MLQGGPGRLTEHVLCAGGADDDLRAQRRHTDLHAAVAVLGQLPGQQLIQLGVEHTVGYELQSLDKVRLRHNFPSRQMVSHLLPAGWPERVCSIAGRRQRANGALKKLVRLGVCHTFLFLLMLEAMLGKTVGWVVLLALHAGPDCARQQSRAGRRGRHLTLA